MGKIEIPKHLYKLALNGSPYNWAIDKEKFCSGLQKHYPFLTYDECVDKFLKIKTRFSDEYIYRSSLERDKQKLREVCEEYNIIKTYCSSEKKKTLQSIYNYHRTSIIVVNNSLKEIGVEVENPPQNIEDGLNWLNYDIKIAGVQTYIIVGIFLTIITWVTWASNFGSLKNI
jgi:hypothetical protein